MERGASTLMRTWDPSAEVSVTAESVFTKLATGPMDRRPFKSMAAAPPQASRAQSADLSSLIMLCLWYYSARCQWLVLSVSGGWTGFLLLPLWAEGNTDSLEKHAVGP